MALLGVAACATADPRPTRAVDELVEAERAFARAATEIGMRDAFLAWLAEDGLVFRPGPVNGRRWFSERPAPAGLLQWTPTYARLSRAGDLGFTTGPWTYTAPDAAVHGHYVSLWRKQPDGTWKVVLDVGTGHPEPPPGTWAAAVDAATLAAPAADELPDPTAARSSLLEAERTLARRIEEQGPSTAYGAMAHASVRLYREGDLPAVGLAAAGERLAALGRRWPHESVSAEVARSGDLGYTYGDTREAGRDEPAGFLRIWTREPGQAWTVVLDLDTTPAPRPDFSG